MRKSVFSPLALVLLFTVALTALPSAAEAQRRGGSRGGHSTVVLGFGLGYRYYDPWFDPWYQYGYPYGRYPYSLELTSAVRIQVKPRQAEVYVNGYRAGLVDDFDGVFQRLSLPPGGYEITLYLPGYRTWSQHIYLTAGTTQKLEFNMETLAPGEPMGPRPVPMASDEQGGMRMGPPRRIPGSSQPSQPPPPEQPRQPIQPLRPVPEPAQPLPLDRSTAGSLGIRVQPGNADILIDGERWKSLNSGDQLVIQLSEGKHHIEIRKSGYEPFSSEIDVKRGELTPINVSLKKG